MDYRLDHPALRGHVVQEGHAKACREHGHAKHAIDGVVQGMCPRCGEITADEDEYLGTVTTVREMMWLLNELSENGMGDISVFEANGMHPCLVIEQLKNGKCLNILERE